MQAGEPQVASCFHSPGLGLKTQSIMPAVCFHGPNPSRPLFTWVLEVRLWSSGLFYKHLASPKILPTPTIRFFTAHSEKSPAHRWLHLFEVQHHFPIPGVRPPILCMWDFHFHVPCDYRYELPHLFQNIVLKKLPERKSLLV